MKTEMLHGMLDVVDLEQVNNDIRLPSIQIAFVLMHCYFEGSDWRRGTRVGVGRGVRQWIHRNRPRPVRILHFSR